MRERWKVGGWPRWNSTWNHLLTKSRSLNIRKDTGWRRAFCRTSQRVWIFDLSKPFWGAGVAKASVKSANISNVQDPKPDELTMSRLNPDENWGEGRTRETCNPLGWPEVRSEKLIEFGNSWFFPKQLWGWRLESKCGGRALNRVPWSLTRSSNQTPNTTFIV